VEESCPPEAAQPDFNTDIHMNKVYHPLRSHYYHSFHCLWS
jgi:hypothetical protein